ncbi:DUF4136 domain-containing protein [Thalassotalea sp. Y01]|uniref:DUF4136 domain-containing protein n=1 Tax=Thalassotalea sp. Y01 TaxID=2729613 RepID=UPI00145E348B|nr:DUF4136 domain-containing protein [Thalassotalea sp. Y01]NMP17169.1 DUF4136 domain-containing protein [Thalassotalea sp. Y01]
MRNILILLFVTTLAACVQVTDEEAMAERQLAISSSHDKDLVLDSNTTYAFTPLQETDLGQRFPAFTAEIKRYLNSRGFRQVEADQQPTFFIGYILEREEDFSDEQLSETFGLNPGLPDLPNLEKGTMLMFVLDGETKQFAWRGAAQGFVIDDIDEQERQHRIQVIVGSMLRQFVGN